MEDLCQVRKYMFLDNINSNLKLLFYYWCEYYSSTQLRVERVSTNNENQWETKWDSELYNSTEIEHTVGFNRFLLTLLHCFVREHAVSHLESHLLDLNIFSSLFADSVLRSRIHFDCRWRLPLKDAANLSLRSTSHRKWW